MFITNLILVHPFICDYVRTGKLCKVPEFEENAFRKKSERIQESEREKERKRNKKRDRDSKNKLIRQNHFKLQKQRKCWEKHSTINSFKIEYERKIFWMRILEDSQQIINYHEEREVESLNTNTIYIEY